MSLLLLALPLIPHLLLHGFQPVGEASAYLLGVAAVVLLLIGHELAHALGWVMFGGVPLRKIRFGFDRKTGNPYAHAQVPMRAWGYRIGAGLPLVITGLLPVLIGILANIPWLTVAGAVLTSGASGDLIVLWIIRALPADALVLDHPKNAGCYVVEP